MLESFFQYLLSLCADRGMYLQIEDGGKNTPSFAISRYISANNFKSLLFACSKLVTGPSFEITNH